jgi:hypothetical protein
MKEILCSTFIRKSSDTVFDLKNITLQHWQTVNGKYCAGTPKMALQNVVFLLEKRPEFLSKLWFLQ